MNRFITSLLVAFAALAGTARSSSSSGTPFQRGRISPSTTNLLFGIRGGGLFGGGKDASAVVEDDAAVSSDKKIYPAMTQEEVEEWLEHVPVFAVTDSNGAGVVLKPDNDTSIFYFFLNPIAANATLTELKSVNEDMDLKVSAFSLGKIWFRLLNGDSNQEVVVSFVYTQIILLLERDTFTVQCFRIGTSYTNLFLCVDDLLSCNMCCAVEGTE